MSEPTLNGKPSRGWGVFWIILSIIILGVTFAPMGILMILHEMGIPVEGIGGGNEMSAVTLVLIFSFCAGLFGTCSPNPKAFRCIVWTLLGLAILNASGCMMILNGLSNIH